MGTPFAFTLQTKNITPDRWSYRQVWCMKKMLWVLFILCLASSSLAEESDRQERVFSPFSVVRFQNDVCGGGSRNGTCLTAEMCKDQSGTGDGTCADGFGVCCVFELKCGEASSQNNTYIVQTSTTTQPVAGNSECAYSICPSSPNIRRIRYDFTTLQLTAQNPAAIVGATTKVVLTAQGSVGKCLDDSLSITGSTGTTPSICGTNSGQHIVVDNDGMSCHQVNFLISSKSTARSWDIWVTQYDVSDLDSTRAGPPGCLQYFTTKTGYVSSYSLLSTISATGTGTTTTMAHLANQQYTICIRRDAAKTKICYSALHLATQPSKQSKHKSISQGSFGIGVSGGASTNAASKRVGASCSTGDYIEIPGLSSDGTIKITSTAAATTRLCGRLFSTKGIAHTTLCTTSYPFRIHVNFDDAELLTTTAKSKMTINEASGYPSGTIGFGLHFTQS